MPDTDGGARPLIIVSAGRSGSTLLHGLLARHERMTWLSRVSDAAPGHPAKQRRVVAAAVLPLLGPLVRRGWPPDECYGFWAHHYPGFARPFRDLLASDVTAPARNRIRRYFGELVCEARPNLLLKVTGWPRARFLADVLDGARFVHIVRDGREVARSLLMTPWWLGWRGPSAWRFGSLTETEDAEWTESGHSFAHLAGIQWRRLMDAAAGCAAEIGTEAWLDVRFEDLCREPDETVTRILEFGGLGPSRAIATALREGTVRTPPERWETDLSLADQRALHKALERPLEKWGYL